MGPGDCLQYIIIHWLCLLCAWGLGTQECRRVGSISIQEQRPGEGASLGEKEIQGYVGATQCPVQGT